MSHSTHSSDSTRPLNLRSLVAEEQQRHKLKHKQNQFQPSASKSQSQEPTELDHPHEASSSSHSSGSDPNDNSTLSSQQQQQQQQQDLDQARKPLDLATLVGRVRQVQKSDPGVLQKPMDTPPPQPAKQVEAEPERHHWYSSFVPHQLRHRHASEGSSSQAQPSTPAPQVEPIQPATPPKELTTMDHAANAFASTSRAKNLKTIEFTVESLAVTGAAAPAFLFQTDERGRRPPPILFQLLRIGIVDSDVKPDVSRQIVFRIELQYGDIKWVIRRTLYEFYRLHLSLSAKHYNNLPRFPNQVSWALSMAKAGLGMKADDKDALMRETNLARRKALQTYLLQVMQELNGQVAYDLYEFLEISALSLTKDMGWKGKEGHVETKVVDISKTFCGIPIGFSEYTRSWAILRDSYMAFMPDISSTECSDVFIFDQHFYVQHKEQILGLNLHHIEIGNSHRKIEMKGEHNREMMEWMEYFHKMQQSSPWVKSHRHGSFAPERENAKVRYYVDGKDYFHAVSDAILAAKNEIYIADWWLSPELYLRRPPEKNEDFRLDRLLKKKAEEGVKIYIVVYKEISLALTLDSAHTKTWLQDMHPNIQVQRHPDHISVTATQFWAHHEKICVVDCRLAFIGGLDLCFGRYDSRTHQLSDYHPLGGGTIWPGQDYSNPRIKDFANVKEYDADLIERKLLSRMPWHDVSIGVAGQPARDIARHFVQRWNFVKREKGMKKSHMKFLTPKGEFVSTRNETGWTGSQKVQLLRSSTTWSQGVELERSIQDAYLENIEKAEHFIYIENQFFVTLAAENGNPDLKNTIGIALVNRILRAHNEGSKFRVIVVMPLMPAFEADIMSSEAGTLRKVMHFQYVSICRGGNSVLERLEANGINPDHYIGFYGLRSFDRIKYGKLDAIVEAVKEAERESALEGASEQVQEPVDVEQAKKQLEQQKKQEREGQLKAHGAVSTAGQAPEDAAKDGKQQVKSAEGGDIRRSKSLASKFLLDPIPRDQEAERIKALARKRKAMDLGKKWDESITKRAMGLSKKEHGYVPATTSRSLKDKLASRQLRNETDQQEREARDHHYRGGDTNNSEPHVLEGLGTMARTAVNTLKGTKEGGDLEPKHHKVTRHPFVHESKSKIGSAPTDGADVDTMKDGNVDNAEVDNMDSSIESPVQQAKEESEAIVEPAPQGSEDKVTKEEAAAAANASSGSGSNAADEDGETLAMENEVEDFVTEQLYIHSKLMIVDDRIIIIGSANINDRSQVGFRDSEIAIVIEDTEMVTSKMNGVEWQAGKTAHALRTDLFKEHLGLLPHVEHDVVTKASILPVDLDAPSKDPEQMRKELIEAAAGLQPQERQHVPYGSQGYVKLSMPDEDDAQASQQWHSKLAQGQVKQAAAQDPKTADQIVMDPLHDDFYESWWRRVANQNTVIFREVFHCVPDQHVETWDDYKAFMPDPKKVLTGHVVMEGATVENVTEKLQGITGHLVEFPTKFLCKENLLGNIVEGAVTPMEIFT
ncbi:hypothetical protein EDD11_000195 [Mortierella claussenii]|nr:hypothetical protein EDD11_000195 [Mortierella claussenii]